MSLKKIDKVLVNPNRCFFVRQLEKALFEIKISNKTQTSLTSPKKFNYAVTRT